MTLSAKKRQQLINDAQPVLQEGEQLLDVTTGRARVTGVATVARKGSLIVTDRRVIVFAKKAFGGHEVKDYAYALLTGVGTEKGWTFGKINIRASADTVLIDQIDKDDVERIADAIRQQMAGAHPVIPPGAPLAGSTAPAPAVDPNPSADFAEQLRKLVALRDDGLLTEDEFQGRRAKLLDS